MNIAGTFIAPHRRAKIAPELPADDIFIAAGLGNAAAVESLLAADPSLAQTQAITYATHGRFYLLDDSYRARQQQIVKLLLLHGADPNSSAPQDEGEGRLSALYGCCRQTGNPVVAKLLLEAGANRRLAIDSSHRTIR